MTNSSKALKALFITPVYPSKDNPVPGIFIHRIAEALSSLNVSVTVVHPVPWVPLPDFLLSKVWRYYKKLPAFDVTTSGVRIIRPRYFSYPRSTVWGVADRLIFHSLKKQIKARIIDADIIHAHFGYPMGCVALLLKKMMGVPCVCTFRGDDINVLPERSSLYRRRTERILRESDLVTSVSQSLADKARQIYDRPIRVLYNGVKLPTNHQSLTKAEAREALNLDEKSFYVLYVGALIEKKGLRELSEVIEGFGDPDTKFIFIGAPINAAEPVVLPPGCIQLGWQSGDVVSKYMSAADVLVLPSYGEGMPNVVVEAAAACLPIVATAVGGVTEILNDDTGTLIEPRSADAIRSALTHVKTNYEEACAKARRLQARVEQHFNLEKNTRSLKEAYEAVIAEREHSSKASVAT